MKYATLDATKIAHNLYVGSHPRDERDVERAGFDLHVVVARELCPLRTPPLRKLTVVCAGINDGVLSLDEAQIVAQAAKTAADHVRRGSRVLITCWAGLNRSTLTTAVALQYLHGLPGRLALRTMRRLRGATVGSETRVLSNPSFATFLAQGGILS